VAFISNRRIVLAATGLGLLLALLTLVLYGPIVIAEPLAIASGLNYFMDTLMFSGSVLCFAASQRQTLLSKSYVQERCHMFGLIVKLTIIPGKRDEMVGILKSSAADMPGCFSYVVAEDCSHEDVIWVTEVWDGMASHDASLSLPAVKTATARARELVSSFEKIAVTSPVWGLGLPTSRAQ